MQRTPKTLVRRLPRQTSLTVIQAGRSVWADTQRGVKCATPVLIFLTATVCFLVGHGDREFVGFETRFVLFAQEMLRNGPSLFPTEFGHPYPDYPATHSFLIYVFSVLFGRVTPVSAVTPSAIVSALTLVVTYLIGAVHSRRWGLLAVLYELLTYQFIASARSVTLDPFVMLAVVTAFYLVYSASMETRRRNEWLALVVMFAGLLFRGPIGLLLPAAPVCLFYLFEKDFARLSWIALRALIVLVLGTGVLFMAAVHQGGELFARDVMQAQVLGRFTQPDGHPAFYNYFAQALINMSFSFPAALLVLGAYGKAITRAAGAELRLMRQLAAWMLVLIVGLSIPAEQKIRYLSPIIPAVSLIAAYPFAIARRERIRSYFRTILRGLGYATPILGLTAIAVLLSLDRWRVHVLDSRYMLAIFAFVVAAIGSIAFSYHRKDVRRIPRGEISVTVAAFVFLTSYITIVEPIRARLHPIAPFVAQIEANRKPEQEVVFYKMKPDGTPLRLLIAMRKPVRVEFAQHPDEILVKGPRAVFITQKSRYDALPSQVRERSRVLFNADLARAKTVLFALSD